MLGTVLETNLFIYLSLLSTTKLKTKNSLRWNLYCIASRSLIFAGAEWIKLSKGSNKRIEYDSQEKLIRDGQR